MRHTAPCTCAPPLDVSVALLASGAARHHVAGLFPKVSSHARGCALATAILTLGDQTVWSPPEDAPKLKDALKSTDN